MNHPPSSPSPNTSASRIEIFHHKLDSSPPSVQHIRTISHPLITTPNDILSLSPDTFLVTNDHVHKFGGYRVLEDLFDIAWNSNSNVIKVSDDQIEIAMGGLHNPNGIGSGHDGRIALVDCSGGALQIVKPDTYQIQDRIQFNTMLDNPTYFTDPYANASKAGGQDYSGYILAGLTRTIEFEHDVKNHSSRVPGLVWSLRKDEHGNWVKKVLMEDDGEWMTTLTTGVIVPIDPSTETSENRLGWLVVTGFMANGVGVMKVEL